MPQPAPKPVRVGWKMWDDGSYVMIPDDRPVKLGDGSITHPSELVHMRTCPYGKKDAKVCTCLLARPENN